MHLLVRPAQWSFAQSLNIQPDIFPSAGRLMLREGAVQKAQELTDRIAKLSPPQQAIVEKLVQKLESRSLEPGMTLEEAIDEFEREHPELLRLLAQ